MKVQTVPIASVVPYARNPRKNAGAVAKVAASLREFGWRQPIVVDAANVVVVGHTRLLAAQQLGMAEVPIHIAEGLTANQIKAYRLADNRVHEEAEWDDDLLALEIADLRDAGLDLALTGFDDDELARLTIEQTEGLTDADDVPEPQAEAVSVLGDVWLLGRHRLVCGDSTTAEAVDAALGGVKPHLCLTDPPYGIGDTASEKNDYVEYDDTRDNLIATVSGFLPLAQTHCKTVVITPGNGNSRLYPSPTWTMAWFTPAGVGSGPWGFCCWQPILCYGKDPKLSAGLGRHPDAIVHTERAEDFGHPCSKPIKFWCWLMERTSEIGDLIYEPFSGSGTTLIAAEMTGRACHAIELSPQYVDVAVRRWQQFTGQTAKLERTGETFDEIAARTEAKEAA